MALVQNIFVLLLFLPTLNAISSQTSSPQEEANAFEESLILQACLNTTNPETCTTRIHTECQRAGLNGPFSILHGALKGTIDEVVHTIDTISGLAALSDSLREEMAIHDCLELLEYSMDELGWSLAEMSWIQSETINMHHEENLRAWLSAALSNQDTCLEGFEGTDGWLKHYIKGSLGEVTQLVSNLLMMYSRMHSIIPHVPIKNVSDSSQDLELPPWVEIGEELMHADPKAMHVDAVVALDGSSRFRSINEAVNQAPSQSSKRYVIYVKKGEYKENVELKKKKTNIMLVGDGIGQTVITGGRSFMQGWTTFRTATFGKWLVCILIYIDKSLPLVL